MSCKPLIGVVLDYETSNNFSKYPSYLLRENYFSSLISCGGIPFPLYHDKDLINSFVEKLDGLVLTGGDFDIDPKIYNQEINGTRGIKPERTNFELQIFQKFFEFDKPILGICGGEQLINVGCGGDLFQDINANFQTAIQHEQHNPANEVSHEVKIQSKTKLSEILNTDLIWTNSSHHQSVNRLGENIKLNAIALDGVVEGIEHDLHKWCVGVQWHPEFLNTKYDKMIIKDFIEHCG